MNKPRTWAPREMQLVADWISSEYPDANYRMNVRLGTQHPRLQGKFLTESEQRMAGVFRRWADAVIITKTELLLVEAAIRPQPGKIAQLHLYEMLLPSTPELEEFKNLTIVKVLLCAIPDPVLIQLARSQGIRVVTYRPDWVDEYISTLYPREQTATLTHPEP